jgi:DnaJ family protein C protein 9
MQAKYRGSEEEQQELLQLYEKHKGSMPRVFEWLMCSDPERDSHRFMDAIEAAIAKGGLLLH